jgi:hypothetical protein
VIDGRAPEGLVHRQERSRHGAELDRAGFAVVDRVTQLADEVAPVSHRAHAGDVALARQQRHRTVVFEGELRGLAVAWIGRREEQGHVHVADEEEAEPDLLEHVPRLEPRG